MRHVIVNKITGEIDPDCPICGYGISGDYTDFDNFVDVDHLKIEITNEEHLEFVASVSIDEKRKAAYTKKIDTKKAAQKLGDRLTIDVPIEIEGPGGKEIIGFEQKPEGIIVERVRVK